MKRLTLVLLAIASVSLLGFIPLASSWYRGVKQTRIAAPLADSDRLRFWSARQRGSLGAWFLGEGPIRGTSWSHGTTAEDLDQLAEFPDLEQMWASGLPVNDKHLRMLRSCQSLKDLRIAETRISDDGLVALQGHPTLESLDLSGTAISDAGLSALVKSLPNLRRLTLRYGAVSDEGIVQLECDRLEFLHVGIDQGRRIQTRFRERHPNCELYY